MGKWASTRKNASIWLSHNPKVAGSNPAPATNERPVQRPFPGTGKGLWRSGGGQMRTRREQAIGASSSGHGKRPRAGRAPDRSWRGTYLLAREIADQLVAGRGSVVRWTASVGDVDSGGGLPVAPDGSLASRYERAYPRTGPRCGWSTSRRARPRRGETLTRYSSSRPAWVHLARRPGSAIRVGRSHAVRSRAPGHSRVRVLGVSVVGHAALV